MTQNQELEQMERFSCFSTNDHPMELPPGFRFHPTDEELITHYLSPKVLHNSFTTKAIGEVDLNKVEPWDLPWKAKMGEKEWYFFCVRDRKYPTGLRTNRATEAGYWKATGKDKEIFRATILVGMKKTLVFYRGRAPRGEKTNWVMHEYRIEGKNSMQNLSKSAKNEWVICRIFKKSSGGKKVHISGLMSSIERGDNMPPLMDLSSDENQTGSNMTYFSNPSEDHIDKTVDEFSSCLKNNGFHKENTQDQSLLRRLLEPNGPCMKQSVDIATNNDISSAISNSEMGFRPFEDQEFSIFPTGHVDLDCLWNY